jgi:hypothetical protein
MVKILGFTPYTLAELEELEKNSTTPEDKLAYRRLIELTRLNNSQLSAQSLQPKFESYDSHP